MENADNLYKRACSFFKQDSLSEALSLFKQALFLYEELNAEPQRASCIFQIGRIYHAQKKFDKSQSLYEDALAIFEKTENKEMIARCNMNLGNIFLQCSNIDKFIDFSSKAIEISRDIKDKKSEMQYMIILAQSYFSLGDVKKAIDCMHEVYNICKTLNDNEFMYKYHSNMGLFLEANDDIKNSWEHYLNSFHIAYEAGQRNIKGMVLDKLSSLFYQHYKIILEQLIASYKKAESQKKLQPFMKPYRILWTINSIFLSTVLDWLDSLQEQRDFSKHKEILDFCENLYKGVDIIDFIRTNGPQIMPAIDPGNALSSIFLRKGDLFMDIYEYESAIHYYQKTLKYYLKEGDQGQQKMALTRLVGAYQEIGDYEEASRLCDEALKCMPIETDPEIESTLFTRLGLISMENREYKQTLKYFESAIEILGDGYEKAKAGLLSNIGNAYLELGNFEGALENLQASRKLFERIGDHHSLAKAGVNLARFAFRIGRYTESAISWCQEAIELFEHVHDYINGAVAYNVQGWLYKSMGEICYAEAFECFAKAIQLMEIIRGKLYSSEISIMFQANLKKYYNDIILFFLEIRSKLPDRFELLLKALDEEAQNPSQFPEYSLSNLYAQPIRKLSIIIYPKESKFNPFSGKYSETEELCHSLCANSLVKSFEYMQKIKSRIFSEMLVDKEIYAPNAINKDLIKTETQLNSEIIQLERDISKGNTDSGKTTKLKQNVLKQEEIFDEIEEVAPEYVWIKRGKTITFEELKMIL